MKKQFTAALLTAVFVLTGVGAGCARPPYVGTGDGDLAAVEIREYEGKDLSSIREFPQNAYRGPQYVNVDDYALTVHGLVENDLLYTYDEVIDGYKSYRKVVTLSCVEGWDVTILWEGILLADLFGDAGVLPGANTVIFRSVDDYSTSLPLDYILDNDIMLAFKMNEVTLPPERGFPFQLVAESKWGYKWIRWLDEIELSNDPSFKGYWEGYGYSNSGDLNKYFLD